MKEINYHKLVRDDIPEIIIKDGKEPISRIASIEEAKEYLMNKVLEELQEFKETPNSEELADLLEVLEALGNLHGIKMDEVYKQKELKKQKRGGFNKRIILEKVVEK